MNVEKLWHQFFQDPSQWWDTRFDKVNARFPDFKHKISGDSLWVDGGRSPCWVKMRLAQMTPGTVQRSVFSWNTTIKKYVKDGKSTNALRVFREMKHQGVTPDKFTFSQVLHACSALASVEEGRLVHEEIAKTGCDSDPLVASRLVGMYCKCGALEEAFKVFNKLPNPDVVTWTFMIMTCVKYGQGKQAINLFLEMQQKGVQPDSVTLTGAIKACTSIGAFATGRQIHAQAIELGYESDSFVASCLIDMYTKCGSLVEASKVFDNTPNHDLVSFGTMIVAYVKSGHGEKALQMFQKMQQKGMEPDSIIFINVLNACASILALEEGRHIHVQALTKGFEYDVVVGNCLVDMYGKCGSIEDACRIFNFMPEQDVVSWNAMIAGYVQCKQVKKALDLHGQMQREGVIPSCVTYVSVLKACTLDASLEDGKLVHAQIIRNGQESDLLVGNCLIELYSKCGSIDDACRVFYTMQAHDIISWNVLILGFVKCGQGEKAIKLFQLLLNSGTQPDLVSFLGVLNACASVAALEEGKHVHVQIIKSQFNQETSIGNALIDMYSKCGGLKEASRVFSNMSSRDLTSWNAMISGYAMHGLAKEALLLFEQLCNQSIEIDSVTFLSLLSACSHAGLVKEGLYLFEVMNAVYDISPSVSHWSCVVDLLGRAGCLVDAEVMIRSLPFQPSASMWTAMLGACRLHGNREMGERIAKHALAVDPVSAGNFVLLSNIYASAGGEIREMKFSV